MPRPLRWHFRERCGDAGFDECARLHVSIAGERDDFLEARALRRGRERVQRARVHRRAVVHEPDPRLIVARLRERCGVAHAEFAGKPLGVQRADAKDYERAGISKDSMLQYVWQL
jgi:hypothetical protein